MMRLNSVNDPNYYLSASGELDRIGSWAGGLASRLGIECDDTQAFKRLMANRTPDGSKLTARDHAERRSGYDLTFSEPKSVSILRELAGDERIDRAREESVREIMVSLVEPMAATRERKLFGNHPVTTGSLAWLDFPHRLGRPINGISDMNGHTHVVLPNATISHGRILALEIRPIKDAAPFIQAAWHANYASKLKGLGYDIRPTKDAFEIAGIHESTIKKFSGRSELIELEAKRREIKSPKGKAALGALTREKKTPIDPDKLHAAWMARLTPAESKAIAETHRKAIQARPSQEAPDHAQHLSDALAWHLKAESVVPERKLLETALRRGVGEVTLQGLQAALPAHTRAKDGGVTYVTSPQAMKREQAILDFADRGGITLKRTKRGEKVTVRPGETLVPNAERLGFDKLHSLVEEAKAANARLVLHAEGMRDYRKPARGEVMAVLEDVAGLRTGQSRPGLKAKAIRVGKQITDRVKRHMERMKAAYLYQMQEMEHESSIREIARHVGIER